MKKSFSVQKFGKLLAGWYELNRRDLPWRRTHDPYKIWVSEIMLQQTQVERVKEYYARFLKKFPKVEDLAAASWEDVLDSWRDPVFPGTPQVIASQRRGLGYYRRARNMHQAAQVIVKDFGGRFPNRYDELQKLPGVGSYTAAAIAAFVYDEKVPALDTNISRVFERVFGDQWKNLKPSERFDFARIYIGVMESRDFNYGLMDLGALVCSARQPKCQECCFRKVCDFALSGGPASDLVLADGFQGRYRGGRLNVAQTGVKVAVGVLIHEGKILICKRPRGKALAGLWEFPGGKLEYGEDERKCLKREFMEELGIEVSVRPHFYKTTTEQDDMEVCLSFHRCSLLLGSPKSLEKQEFRWVRVDELEDFEFPQANQEILSVLKEKPAMFLV